MSKTEESTNCDVAEPVTEESSFAAAMALFDSDDEVPASFALDNGKYFDCRLRRIRDASEWQKMGDNIRERGKLAAKGGLPVTLPNGTQLRVTNADIVSALTMCEYGVATPLWNFGQWVAFSQKSGPLIILIADRVGDLNGYKAIEQAKNDSEQATGTETPDAPA